MSYKTKIPHILMWGYHRLKISNERKISKRQLSRFCGQLKMLLSSGVSLLEALQIIKTISRYSGTDHLIQSVSEGESLASAMRDRFPSLVISSIECAEKTGTLEEVLARLSRYYEERAEVEEKILSALLYPSFVIILCLFSLFILLVFVLPNFKALFQDLGAEMPLYTQIIIGIGETFSKIWYVLFLLLLVVVGFIFRYKKTPAGALKIDQLFLKIKFISREQFILWFRTLGTLLKSGIPIVEALNATVRSSKNLAFQKIVLEIKAGIENGEKLSSLLLRYKMFPVDAIQMIIIAENSGKLDEMLVSISDFYEKEKELFIKRFTVMLEPALTLFVGVIVGIITLAMFMPMMNVISKMQ